MIEQIHSRDQIEANTLLRLNNLVGVAENLDPAKYDAAHREKFGKFLAQRIRNTLISTRIDYLHMGIDYQTATSEILALFQRSTLQETLHKFNIPPLQSTSRSLQEDIAALERSLKQLENEHNSSHVLTSDTRNTLEKARQALNKLEKKSNSFEAGNPPGPDGIESLRNSPRNPNGTFDVERAAQTRASTELKVSEQAAGQIVDAFLANGKNYTKVGLESMVGFIGVGGIDYVVKNYHASSEGEPRYQQFHDGLIKKQQIMDDKGFTNYAPITLVKRGSTYYQVQRRVTVGAYYAEMKQLLDRSGLHVVDLKDNVFTWTDSKGVTTPILIDFGYLSQT